MNNWEIEQAFLQMIETFPAMAQAQWEYYRELKKSGFDDEQAMFLVSELLANIMGMGRE